MCRHSGPLFSQGQAARSGEPESSATNSTVYWIPAYAGMKDKKLIRASLIELRAEMQPDVAGIEFCAVGLIVDVGVAQPEKAGV
ncbi:MAG: hypothetical protein FD165_1552 [Gammaproteobacteria bacterium]|nr:MAG: hypothetical protein FD165_1552 [Gammaproteobacteria bacterium]